MKRAIVKFIDGGYCNLEANYIDADDTYISIHLGDKIVGIFRLEQIKCVYISEKSVTERGV